MVCACCVISFGVPVKTISPPALPPSGSTSISQSDKWLRAYEQAALYGATLEVVDYSPEIDIYLRVLCFPTCRGHCGCILSDVSQINYIRTSREAPEALLHYFRKLLDAN